MHYFHTKIYKKNSGEEAQPPSQSQPPLEREEPPPQTPPQMADLEPLARKNLTPPPVHRLKSIIANKFAFLQSHACYVMLFNVPLQYTL